MLLTILTTKRIMHHPAAYTQPSYTTRAQHSSDTTVPLGFYWSIPDWNMPAARVRRRVRRD